MLDPSKVRAVLSYLQGEFPEQTVHDSYDTERCAHSFRIDNDSVLYLVVKSHHVVNSTVGSRRNRRGALAYQSCVS
jgi:hypothetical protein